MKIKKTVCLAVCALLAGCNAGNTVNEKEITATKEHTNYEEIYLDYIETNQDKFSAGMMFTDLNDDDIPELYSVKEGEHGGIVNIHIYKDGIVSESDCETYVNPELLGNHHNFYEGPHDFFAVYENKDTGKKVFISQSGYDANGEYFMHVIKYDGESVMLTDEKAGVKVGNYAEIPDIVMQDYKVTENELYSKRVVNENKADVFMELVQEFKTPEKEIEYGEIKDGKFSCFIHDIDFENNEIVLIPNATMSLEEYENAMNGDKTFMINGETLDVVYKEPFPDCTSCESELHSASGDVYHFDPPCEHSPVSEIREYRGNKPLRVKMSENMFVRNGVGGYDENGDVSGYEALGRKEQYRMNEFVSVYSQCYTWFEPVATIENNELIYIDILYHP